MKLTAKEKIEHIMIHLPEDAKTLRKIVKLLVSESIQLSMPAGEKLYQVLVKDRKPMAAHDPEDEQLDEDIMVFRLVPKTTVMLYKKRFPELLAKHPEIMPLANMIYEELRALNFTKFTYMDLMRAIEKRHNIGIPRKPEFKPFVYALLRDARYTMGMVRNHKLRKNEAVFYTVDLV